jgi:hypothetical protein
MWGTPYRVGNTIGAVCGNKLRLLLRHHLSLEGEVASEAAGEGFSVRACCLRHTRQLSNCLALETIRLFLRERFLLKF